MSNQFFHVNTYARKPSSSGGSKWSCADIQNEENRIKENSPHVINPAQPIHFFGPTKIEKLTENLELFLDEKKQEVNLKNGGIAYRKVREDAHVMLSSVFSWPEPIDNFDSEKAEKFFSDCVGFIEKKFGNVACAIVHQDEAFPHIHIHSFSDNARKIHPGWKAKTEAKKAGLDPKEQNAAYRAAMVQMQDDFFLEVGQKHGLDRLGPKRQRLSRDDWAERKKSLAQTAEVFQRVGQKLNGTKQALGEVRSEGRRATKALENLKNELEKSKKTLEKLDQKITAEKQTLEAVQAETRGLKRAAELAEKAGGVVAVLRKVFYKAMGRETPEIQALKDQIKDFEKTEQALIFDVRDDKKRAEESAKQVDFLKKKVESLGGELQAEKHELAETIREAREVIGGLKDEIAVLKGEKKAPEVKKSPQNNKNVGPKLSK